MSEERIRALEHRIAELNRDALACVSELADTNAETRHLVAERLPALGSAILPGISDILRDATSPKDVIVLAAIVGVEVGDRHESVDVLANEIAAEGEFAVWAVRKLARHRVDGAGPIIAEALEALDPDDIDAVVVYLEALSGLGQAIPSDVRVRLSQSSAWQVRSAVDQYYPEAEDS